MSDQGERGARWTEMSENDDREPRRLSFPEVPEGSSGNGDGPAPHDVWGKVEQSGDRRPAQPEERVNDAELVEPKIEPVRRPPAAEDEAPTGPQPVVDLPEDEAHTGPQPVVTWDDEPAAVPSPRQEAHREEPEAERAESNEAAPQRPAFWDEPKPEPVANGTAPQRQAFWDEPEPVANGTAPQRQAFWDDAEPAPAEAPVVDDVKVAPVPAEAPQQQSPEWEGSLFDGDGEGDPRYAAVTPTGAGTPAKPGKPSSGNWQMPDWMADEDAADTKLGGNDGGGSSRGLPAEDEGGRSRLVLFGGVGLLAVAVVAAGGVYFMKNKSDSGPDASEGKPGRPAVPAAGRPKPPAPQLPPDQKLPAFPGKKTKAAGRASDTHSGLVYPRLGKPWQVPTKKNKLGVSGWSGQQIVVTERRPGQVWYGQLLTGTLHPMLRTSWQGPQSVKPVAALAAKGLENNYYAFPHRTQPLASQALNVSGHKGWLVASRLAYKRPGVRATGEVVLTAVIDTGRPTPAVVFASMPNTHAKMLPDLTQFITNLKVAS